MKAMHLGHRAGKLFLILMTTALLGIGVAACGSDDSDSTSAAETGSETGAETTEETTSIPPYDGPEKALPTSYAEPEIIDGEEFVVGYLNPQAGVEGLQIEEEAIGEQAEEFGGKMIAFSIESDPAKQVNSFNTLLAQGVTAIVMQPVEPKALTSQLAEAEKRGIPVIAASSPADAPTPNLPGYVTNVLQSADQCAYLNARTLAEAAPGSKTVIMGTALPYPQLEYSDERAAYWAEKLGLDLTGEVKTKGVTPDSGSETMGTLLTQYPDAESVMVWLDSIALGAATKARSQGKTEIKIVGSNGEKQAVEAVEAGQMFGTCKYDFAGVGRQAAIAAYNAQTKQNLPLPEKIVVPPSAITQDNVG